MALPSLTLYSFLQGEFAKIESFFRSKVAQFLAEFRGLCKRVGKVNVAVPLSPRLISHFSDLGSRLGGHADEAELIQGFLQFARQVDTLRGYVMTNAQALVKICKKHDKISPIKIRDHFTRVLARCTFFNSREFGGLIADMKVLSLELFERFTGKAPCDEDSFSCPVCSHVLCNPLVLSCGHRCCISCVSASWFSQHKCPVCCEECQLAEERMRVDLLQSHFQQLVDASQKMCKRSHSADHVKQACASAGCPKTLRRVQSDASIADAICSDKDGTSGSMPRNHSDSALSSAASVSSSTCALESPCSSCASRSLHVHLLRNKLDKSGQAKLASAQPNRIIAGIIKENEERCQRERRLSSMSGASASSDARVAQEFVGDGEHLWEGAAENGSAQNAKGGCLPALIIPSCHLDGGKLMTLEEIEDNPWSPTKMLTWDLRRTSSSTVAVAQEMWGKVHDMQAQKMHDRSVRVRLWMLEVVTLLTTLLFCLRVGYPDVVCPGLDSERPGRMASLWRRTVCGSWGGLVADASKHDQRDVANLQAERTRSLHLALDNMVRGSMRK